MAALIRAFIARLYQLPVDDHNHRRAQPEGRWIVPGEGPATKPKMVNKRDDSKKWRPRRMGHEVFPVAVISNQNQ